MKNFVIFLGLIIGLASAMNIKEFEEKYHDVFADPEEEAKAAEALAKAEAHINKQHEKFVEGKANFDEEINVFSDMIGDEFAQEKLGELVDDEPSMGRIFSLGLIHDDGENTPEELAELEKIYAAIDRETLPSSYDSRALGLVTSVKNQGLCGACVAFATTGVLESNLLKAGASMDGLDVSDQHLLDCAYGCIGDDCANGCKGADGNIYAKWYNNIAGGPEMVHENHYPYVQKENNYKCKATGYWHPGYKIEKGFWDYDCSDEKMMKLIYQYGAISTGVGVDEVDGDHNLGDFVNYKSGVFDICTTTKTNHAVVIVGWGTENGIDYWIIKNSWSSWWGEQGYIRLKRSTCAVRRCVWFTIKPATTTILPDHTTEMPPDFTTEEPQEQSSCDMTKIFGEINGEHTLKLIVNGNYYDSEVTCIDGVCKATNPNILDSCHYICGTFGDTCDHANEVKCFETGKFDGNMKKNGGIEIDIDVISNVADPESCQKECQKNSECKFWTYNNEFAKWRFGRKKCWLQNANAPEKPVASDTATRGPKDCPSYTAKN